MENELLLPLLWTVVFGVIFGLGFRKLTKKNPTNKKWVRPPTPKSQETSKEE